MSAEKNAKKEAKRLEKVKKTSEDKTIIEKAKEITEKTTKPEEKTKKEKVIEEKVVTIGLRKVLNTSRKKRVPRAIKIIKARAERIAKKPVKVSEEINRLLWERGIENPPNKLRIKIIIKEDNAEIAPA